VVEEKHVEKCGEKWHGEVDAPKRIHTFIL
jgi:hypothetical protein